MPKKKAVKEIKKEPIEQSSNEHTDEKTDDDNEDVTIETLKQNLKVKLRNQSGNKLDDIYIDNLTEIEKLKLGLVDSERVINFLLQDKAKMMALIEQQINLTCMLKRCIKEREKKLDELMKYQLIHEIKEANNML